MKGVGGRSPQLLTQRAPWVTSAAWGSWVTSGSAPKRKEICLPEAVVWARCLSRCWTVVNPVWWWHRHSLAWNRIRCSAHSAEWRAAPLPDSATYSALSPPPRQQTDPSQRATRGPEGKKKEVWAKNVTKNEEGDGNPHRTTMAAVFADVSTIPRAPWCSLDQTDHCQHAESRCCRQQHLRNIETQLGQKHRGTHIYF